MSPDDLITTSLAVPHVPPQADTGSATLQLEHATQKVWFWNV